MMAYSAEVAYSGHVYDHVLGGSSLLKRVCRSKLIDKNAAEQHVGGV